LLIRKLRASRFKTVLSNPEPKLDDHSEFDEELANLERYELRTFTSSPIPYRIRVADPSALLRVGTACFHLASCYLDCLIIVGQS
jgi:hypothetical protein